MVNKVTLIGRLGKDPESRETNSGLQVTELRVATSRPKSKDGEQQSDWHTIVCFGKTAEIAAKYLSKGRQVYVDGRIQYDTWDDRETGKKRTTTKIVANQLNFLGGKNDGEQSSYQPTKSSNRNSGSNSYSNDADIPF